MTEHEIDVHADVTLPVDTFGDTGDPPIVLLPAAVAAGESSKPADAWSDAICEQLAAGLRFVVRYADRSVNGARGDDDQVGDRGNGALGDDDRAGDRGDADRASDLVALLDALGLARAHLVARAEAASIAGLVANRHPDRVVSLIVVAHPRERPAAEPVVETGAPTYVVAGADDVLVTAILRHTSGGWQHQADRLAGRSLALDDPTAWFDKLYTAASAGEVEMPWDRDEVNPVLAGWAVAHEIDGGPVDGQGRRALVVGAGLGRDAEFVALLGFRTTAFDVSPTAIANVRTRYPASAVDYHVANLLDPPPEWSGRFDLVVEIYTIQALPRSVRNRATANVRAFVAPGGTLLVIQAYAEAKVDHGPPWPPTRDEIDAIAGDALAVEQIDVVDAPAGRRWLARFVRTD